MLSPFIVVAVFIRNFLRLLRRERQTCVRRFELINILKFFFSSSAPIRQQCFPSARLEQHERLTEEEVFTHDFFCLTLSEAQMEAGRRQRRRRGRERKKESNRNVKEMRRTEKINFSFLINRTNNP